jgi:hypothetical protein
LDALSTTVSAISMTRLPPDLATFLSRSNACRGRSRCRSGEHPDGLLDANPRGQGVLELGDRDGEPRRLAFLGRSRWARGRRRGRPELGGQQVGEHHGAGQVGGLLVSDLPALPATADHQPASLGRRIPGHCLTCSCHLHHEPFCSIFSPKRHWYQSWARGLTQRWPRAAP